MTKGKSKVADVLGVTPTWLFEDGKRSNSLERAAVSGVEEQK